MMSRMLQPSPGEVADRQTILELKLQHARTQASRQGTGYATTQHFEQEHAILEEYLESKWLADLPAGRHDNYDRLYSCLASINSELWRREDEARLLRKETTNDAILRRAGELLFEITRFNDERANIVQEINGLFGIPFREKLYETNDPINTGHT